MKAIHEKLLLADSTYDPTHAALLLSSMSSNTRQDSMVKQNPILSPEMKMTPSFVNPISNMFATLA